MGFRFSGWGCVCWRCRGCWIIGVFSFRCANLWCDDRFVVILLVKSLPPNILRLSVARLNPTTTMATQDAGYYIPEELILNILECSCVSIVQDLASQEPFPIPANHFLQLRLVCKCFNRIVTNCIRVKTEWLDQWDWRRIPKEGKLMEQWLPDLQLNKYYAFKEANTVETVRNVCGSVWYNPGFFSLFKNLFCTPGTSEDFRVWLMYRAPDVFTKQLEENDEYYRRPKTGEQSIQPRNVILRDEKGKFEIEIVPGRNQFRYCFHCAPYQGYFATSVTSFKSPGQGVTISGTGPIWLWYRSIHISTPGGWTGIYWYLVVDYAAKRAINSDGVVWEFGENTVVRMPSEKLELQG